MQQRPEIFQMLDEMPIIDTHEHIRPLAEVRQGPWDFIELCKNSYVASDLEKTGKPGSPWPDADLSLAERWAHFEPYAQRAENTAYYRSLILGCKKLHRLEEDEVNADNFAALAERMEESRERDDLFDYALGEVGHIRYALQDPHWDAFNPDTGAEVLTPVLRINAFVICPFEGQTDHNGTSPYDYAERLGFEVTGFDSYLELIGRAMEHHKRAGAVAVKSSLAYDRDLDFAQVERSEARCIFEGNRESLTPEQERALHDYLMHAVVDIATELGLPVQIHTGIRAGSGDVRGTNPVLLTDLLLAHPKARFDLFHGGYPYCSELAVMAKGIANVWLDMCWLPIISPSVIRRQMQEWVETVPGSKLLWGGDCGRVEAALGALAMAKGIVARMLMAKVKEMAYFSEKTAMRLARGIFHDNAAELFFGADGDSHPARRDDCHPFPKRVLRGEGG